MTSNRAMIQTARNGCIPGTPTDVIRKYIEIDPSAGVVTRAVALAEPGWLIFSDLARRDSDGALFAIGMGFQPLVGVPPPPEFFLFKLDPGTGLTANLGKLTTSAVHAGGGLAFEPGSELLFSSGREEPALQTLDPPSGEVISSIPLDYPWTFESLDFNPEDGTLYAMDPLSLVTIDKSTGEVSVLKTFPVRMWGIAWAHRTVDEPAPQELFVPIVTAANFQDGSQLITDMSLFNTSSPPPLGIDNSTATPTVEFFTGSGIPTSQNAVICQDGPDPGAVLSPGQGIRLQTAGTGFEGWARIVWPKTVPRQISAEISLIEGMTDPCATRLDLLDSRRIRAQLRIPAVQAGGSFSAPALIGRYRESAFSIVNPSAGATARVTIQALLDDGSGFDINEIDIPPLQRVSDLLFALLIKGKVFIRPPDRPRDFRGLVRITSDHPVAVAGLNVLLPQGHWATIPISSP